MRLSGLSTAVIPSPLGALRITASDKGIVSISMGKTGKVPASSRPPHMRACLRELREYFSGTRTGFTFPIDVRTGTPFQRSVWKALSRVPHGTTLSYAELARRAGKPKAIRAAATAVGKNPIGIVLPCHRIIPAFVRLRRTTADKPFKIHQIGQFAWGADKKAWLLNHERVR